MDTQQERLDRSHFAVRTVHISIREEGLGFYRVGVWAKRYGDGPDQADTEEFRELTRTESKDVLCAVLELLLPS